jgi:hypothetical protein
MSEIRTSEADLLSFVYTKETMNDYKSPRVLWMKS